MKTQDEIRNELGEYFQDSVYWCERVPEAWSYGTMSLEDFVPAWDDDDILDSILEICEVPNVELTLADHVEGIKKYLRENYLPEMTEVAFKADLNDIREALDAREAKGND